MNRSHVIAGAAIALAGLLYHWAGSSGLLGAPDPLMGTKTLLFVISAVGMVWFVNWLNRRNGQS
jgi:uncharacterized RDD family membrane protein YckC